MQIPAGLAGRSWLSIAAGVGPMLAAVLIIVACATPYVYFPGRPSRVLSTLTVFSTFFPHQFWFAAQPVALAVAAAAAGLVLIAWTNRLLHAFASGVLVAAGVQAFLLFMGFARYASTFPSASPGPGGFIGIVAALIIVGAGVVGAIGISRSPGSRPA